MSERGLRPWMVVTEKEEAFLDDYDDEMQAQSMANLANQKAKKLEISTTYKVVSRVLRR
jgi:hypothetical protein